VAALMKVRVILLSFWDALALLADPGRNGRWVTGIRCPHCRSARIASWGEARCGETDVPDAAFNEVASLLDDGIFERLVGKDRGGTKA
jgi:hypothetical protein